MDETQLEQQSLKLVPGNIIAQRYKIIQQIGSGGMGAVFKVEHTTLHKTMALKLMHAHRKNQSDLSRLQREAKAASALNHPNLVAVHDFGSTETGDLFIAMDFIEGKSLSQEIDATTALPQDEAIDVFIQVCEGMAAAHSKGVLHRDLKPSNINCAFLSGKKTLSMPSSKRRFKILTMLWQITKPHLTKPRSHMLAS